jgi:hypothetical protein
MEFMLILSEDPQLVATEEQRAEAVQRVGEYAMNLVGDGTLKGGSPLRPGLRRRRHRRVGAQVARLGRTAPCQETEEERLRPICPMLSTP